MGCFLDFKRGHASLKPSIIYHFPVGYTVAIASHHTNFKKKSELEDACSKFTTTFPISLFSKVKTDPKEMPYMPKQDDQHMNCFHMI